MNLPRCLVSVVGGPKIPADTREVIQKKFDSLLVGEVNPFKGPIKDWTGQERIASGVALSNEFMYAKWDWYVDGIRMSDSH